MQPPKAFVLLLALLSMLAPGLAHAADVAVFPVETTTVAPLEASAIGELLAQSYAATSKRAVLMPMRTEAALGSSASYQEAALKLGVTEYLRTSAVSVGHKLVLQVVRYDTTGLALYSETMTAASIEDVPTVAERLSLALQQQVSDLEVRTYKNVTLSETRPQNRVRTETLWGFKAGVHMPFANDATYAVAGSLGLDFRLEHDLYFLEFGASLVLATDTENYESCYDYSTDAHCKTEQQRKHGSVGGLGAEIGASHYLTRGDVGLYAGGGLSPRITMDSEDALMVFVYGQLGVMMPRDASTRFYADLRVSQSVSAAKLDNGSKRWPTEPTLLVGVAF
jgi:hypothetical protein